jgi:hypothetical protein
MASDTAGPSGGGSTPNKEALSMRMLARRNSSGRDSIIGNADGIRSHTSSFACVAFAKVIRKSLPG